MDYGLLARALRRGWLPILLCVALGLAASVLYLRLAPVTYTARSDVYVSTLGGLNVTELSAGASFAEQQARNLSLIATRERVLQPVVQQLGLTQTSADLAKSVTATVPANTSIISLEVTDGSAGDAALIANAVATTLLSTAADLLPPAREGAPAIRLQVVQAAVAAEFPSAPSVLVAPTVGIAGGLVVGLGLAFVLQARREVRAAA